MIDASAFLCGWRRARGLSTRAPPLRDAHAAALAAGFTRRAAPLGCVVQLFAPHRPPPTRTAAGRRGRWRTRTPSTPAGIAPAWAAWRATARSLPPRRCCGDGRAWRAEPRALAMAEHACGATAENPHAPAPDEPADSAAAVGGSSSGSAVAVVAGLCPASLGTDTAGSVRMPVIDLRPDRPEAHAGTLVRARRGRPRRRWTRGVIARDALTPPASSRPPCLPATKIPGCPGWIDAGARAARPRDWRIANALRSGRSHGRRRADWLRAAPARRRQAEAGRAARPGPPEIPAGEIVLQPRPRWRWRRPCAATWTRWSLSTRAIALLAGPCRPSGVSPRAGGGCCARPSTAARDCCWRPASAQACRTATRSRPPAPPSTRELAALHRHHAYVNFLACRRWCCRWA